MIVENRMLKFEEIVLLLILFLFFVPTNLVIGQQDSVAIYSAKADSFLQHRHLSSANQYLHKALQLDSFNLELKKLKAKIDFERGRFFELDESLIYLMDSLGLNDPELISLRALHLHHTYEFDQAIFYYKKYLRTLSMDDPERAQIAEKIMRASSGLMIPGRRLDVLVENMGPVVNTEADEIRPIFSPNSLERLYFSSNRIGSTGERVDADWLIDTVFGHFPLDLYQSNLVAGQFRDVKPLSEEINSPLNNILLDFSEGGRVLFYFKGFSREVGRVFSDTFGFSKPESFRDHRFLSPFIPELGDQSLTMVNDSIMIFSSARPGGFGGYDLYISLFRDGQWLAAVNMGPEINSQWDDLDPFMTKGGRELFFSSNRLISIGGFDIYHSRFFESGNRWLEPENIGLPISSASNDRHFRIGLDGKTCVFSSDRKEGIGGFDLYLAYFRNEWQDHSASLSKRLINKYFPPSSMIETVIADTLIQDQDTVVSETILAESESAENNNLITDPADKTEMDSLLLAKTPPDSVLGSFFYDEYGNILYEDNLQEIQKLTGILGSNQDWLVKLKGFSNTSDPLARQLFFSVKRAEEIANLLIDGGISPSRLTIRAYGNQYLIEGGDEIQLLSDQLNRRVDIVWYSEKERISGPLRSGSNHIYFERLAEQIESAPSESGLVFRVQIAASKSLYEHEVFRQGILSMVERKMDNEFYRYLMGAERSFAAVAALQESLKVRGFDNAFIVAYLDGRRLATSEINELSDKHPELKNFK